MSNRVRACAARLAFGGMNGPRPVPPVKFDEDEDGDEVDAEGVPVT